MTEQKVSVARIAFLLVGIFVLLILLNTCRHSWSMRHLNDETAAEAQRSLPKMFGVEFLPASMRNLQCEGVDVTCNRFAHAVCSFEIDPGDFDTLFDHDQFREYERRKPLSEALDDYIGPNFDVARSFQGGNEEEMYDVTILTNRQRDRVAVSVGKDMHFDCY